MYEGKSFGADKSMSGEVVFINQAAEQLFEISRQSSGQCWSLNTYCPVPGPVPTSPANRDYAPGFTAAIPAISDW